jgi:phage/plasmid-associated DNA primase
MVGNDLPAIRDVGHGMKRRFLLISFDARIPVPQQDTRLFEKLQREGSGILNWMLDGLKAYHDTGLQIPKTIQDASEDYFQSEDIVGQWLQDCCVIGPSFSCAANLLYNSYLGWTMKECVPHISKNYFTRQLNAKSIKMSLDRRKYQGVNIMP